MGPDEKKNVIVILAVIFIGGLICLGIYTSYVPLLNQYGNPLEGFTSNYTSNPFSNWNNPLKAFTGTP